MRLPAPQRQGNASRRSIRENKKSFHSQVHLPQCGMSCWYPPEVWQQVYPLKVTKGSFSKPSIFQGCFLLNFRFKKTFSSEKDNFNPWRHSLDLTPPEPENLQMSLFRDPDSRELSKNVSNLHPGGNEWWLHPHFLCPGVLPSRYSPLQGVPKNQL